MTGTAQKANVVLYHRRRAQAELGNLLAPFQDERDDADMTEWLKWHNPVLDMPRLLLLDTRRTVRAQLLMAMIVPDDSWLPFSWPQPGAHHAQMRMIRYELLEPELLHLALETIVVCNQHLVGTPHPFDPSRVLIELMVHLPDEAANRAFARLDWGSYGAFETLMLRSDVPDQFQSQALSRALISLDIETARRGANLVIAMRELSLLVRHIAQRPVLPVSEDVFTRMVDYLFERAGEGMLHEFFSDTLTAVLDNVSDYEIGAQLVRRLLSGQLACPGNRVCISAINPPQPTAPFNIEMDRCGQITTYNDTGLLLVRQLQRRYAEEDDIAEALQAILDEASGSSTSGDMILKEGEKISTARLRLP